MCTYVGIILQRGYQSTQSLRIAMVDNNDTKTKNV